jgi:hypothetical protein
MSASAGAAEKLKAYLTQPVTHDSLTHITSVPAWFADAVVRVSPIYFDTVIDLLDRLADFPPRVDRRGIIQWESFNARRFQRTFAVTTVPDLLIAAAKSTAFDWSYVWRDDFEGIFIVSSEDEESTAALERDLHAGLLRRAQRRRTTSVQDRDEATLQRKVRVRSVQSLAANVRSRLEEVLTRRRSRSDELPRAAMGRSTKNSPSWTNVWFYQLKQLGYVLGYANNSAPDREDAAFDVLSWDDSARYALQLQEVWRDDISVSLAGRSGI